MELGKKIRQLRFKAELTQEQLAEKLGLGPQAVSKWENGASMPDITLLPRLAEIFGVSIDDLFDLSVEQRLNRIENRLDLEKNLPQDVFWEYEEYLKSQLAAEPYKKRATSLLAYLYWHRMNSAAENAGRYAREAVRMSPGEKDCQWILQKAEGHVVWDWNLANHAKAIDFYRELTEEHPDLTLPYCYLIDNLIADHRTEEAEQALARYSALEKANRTLAEVYRARIALARFDKPAADAIIEKMAEDYAEDDVYLFEAAQYYAMQCEYEKAIACYEQSFAHSKRHPRFIDELQGIMEIYEIMGDTRKAIETCDRIIDLLQRDWGMTEEVGLQNIQNEKARLIAKMNA